MSANSVQMDSFRLNLNRVGTDLAELRLFGLSEVDGVYQMTLFTKFLRMRKSTLSSAGLNEVWCGPYRVRSTSMHHWYLRKRDCWKGYAKEERKLDRYRKGRRRHVGISGDDDR